MGVLCMYRDRRVRDTICRLRGWGLSVLFTIPGAVLPISEFSPDSADGAMWIINNTPN